MNFGVIVFPGSNGDHDALHAIGEVLGQPVRAVWHRETSLDGIDCVVLPGGFAYGDYLRAGAIAGFAPVMNAVREFALGGGPVLGICNGFQVLCEAGLLPGALLPNEGLRFVCRQVELEVVNADTVATAGCEPGERLSIPVKHMSGRWFAPGDDRRGASTVVAGQEVPLGPDLVFEATDVRGLALHVEVCEDMWVPVPPSAEAALAGATVLANLSGSPITVGRAEDRHGWLYQLV